MKNQKKIHNFPSTLHVWTTTDRAATQTSTAVCGCKRNKDAKEQELQLEKRIMMIKRFNFYKSF